MRDLGTVGITGVDGYIGGFLARLLWLEGYQVLGVDDFSAQVGAAPEPSPNGPRVVRADFGHADAWHVLREAHAIVHLAAFSGVEVCQKDPARTQAVNVEATGVLVRQCAEVGVPIALASSGAVYGDAPGAVTETTPVAPRSVYAQSKLDGEKLFHAAGFPAARMGNVYGGYLAGGRWVEKQNVVRRFLDQASSPERRLTVHEPGSQVRSFVALARIGRYWERLVDRLITRRSVPSVMLFSGENASVRQVAELVANDVRPPIELVSIPNPRKGADAAGTGAFDNARTREALGLDAEEGRGDLREFIASRVRRLNLGG
jgi:nucleoside-diphosphate-sugar epimerase